MTTTRSRSAPGTILSDGSVSPAKKKPRTRANFKKAVHYDGHPDPYDRLSRNVMTKAEREEEHFPQSPRRPGDPRPTAGRL